MPGFSASILLRRSFRAFSSLARPCFEEVESFRGTLATEMKDLSPLHILVRLVPDQRISRTARVAQPIMICLAKRLFSSTESPAALDPPDFGAYRASNLPLWPHLPIGFIHVLQYL